MVRHNIRLELNLKVQRIHSKAYLQEYKINESQRNRKRESQSSRFLENETEELGKKALGRLTDGVVMGQFVLQPWRLHIVSIQNRRYYNKRYDSCVSALKVCEAHEAPELLLESRPDVFAQTRCAADRLTEHGSAGTGEPPETGWEDPEDPTDQNQLLRLIAHERELPKRRSDSASHVEANHVDSCKYAWKRNGIYLLRMDVV